LPIKRGRSVASRFPWATVIDLRADDKFGALRTRRDLVQIQVLRELTRGYLALTNVPRANSLKDQFRRFRGVHLYESTRARAEGQPDFRSCSLSQRTVSPSASVAPCPSRLGHWRCHPAHLVRKSQKLVSQPENLASGREKRRGIEKRYRMAVLAGPKLPVLQSKRRYSSVGRAADL
jgi:hypothetical protein